MVQVKVATRRQAYAPAIDPMQRDASCHRAHAGPALLRGVCI